MLSLVECILQFEKSNYNAPAIMYKNEFLSYVSLAKKIKSAGALLKKCGVKKGDRVLLTAITNPCMVVAYLAIQYCGGVVVFVDVNNTGKSVYDIYCRTGATLLLTEISKDKIENIQNVMSIKALCNNEASMTNFEYAVPDEDDVAEILFTTGTTGTPKGIAHTYKSVNSILMNTIKGSGMLKNDSILLPLPLGHSLALRVLRAARFLGASIILQNGFAFVNDIERNQKRFSCTAMVAVPAAMEMLYQNFGEKFSEVLGRFRYIEVGAGSLSIAQRKKFSKVLPNTIIYNTWGSSETGGVFFLNIRDALQKADRLGTLGKPLPDIQIQVLDECGEAIDSSYVNPGRMALKGDMIMHEYWGDIEMTKKTIQDGWVITNDIVYLDQEGFWHMLGRSDDIVKVMGENVSTIEVENAAGQFDGVLECACIGVDDPDLAFGQVLVLFYVVSSSNFEKKQFCDFLFNSVERYKVPKSFVLLLKIPRNKMGKIDRTKLKTIWDTMEKRKDEKNFHPSTKMRAEMKKYTEIVFYDNTDMDDKFFD